MRPPLWHPPVELSAQEQSVMSRIRRAKLFTFLRRVRHELFSDSFQEELGTIFADSAKGCLPVAPAKLALVTILQAYTGVSDDEALEALVMDRRWQLVLDCLDCEVAPFGKGTLVRFRTALIEKGLDRRLIERTIEMAERDREFGSRQLRAALDSSPLWGVGRVEDTYNLLGHALRKAIGVIARQQGRGLAEVATEAGAELVAGSSLKAALDLDWDDPEECQTALEKVLGALESLERWLGEQGWVAEGPAAQQDSAQRLVAESLEAAHQVQSQDVVISAEGKAELREGVAKDRRISVEDAEMRHGRKSSSRRVDGFKRHILRDLDSQLVRAVGVTAANAPEASVTEDIVADLAPQEVILSELHIDRAYLSSTLVRERPPEMEIYCKAWPVREGKQFPKTAFTLDWEQGTIRCPNEVVVPFKAGDVVHFPKEDCTACPKRDQCTGSAKGRSVSIHPDERLLIELRERQHTPVGRAKLRERVGVEHSLAHIGHWQGPRARYRGLRKNLFDLRRTAVVHNLHVIDRACHDRKEKAA